MTGDAVSVAPAPDASASAGRLARSRRIIVKIGSALLVHPRDLKIQAAWLDALADDLAVLRAAGHEIAIVTSGAVAVGRVQLGLGSRALRLEEKQAAAAVGQIRLAHLYQETLARHGLAVGQILLTREDTETRRRHLNARATIGELLTLGIVPVINENDTVTTAEIRFGDNDRLAARVAQMISADALVLLSDVDGLYTADPRKDPTARHLPVVEALTPEIMAMAGPPLPGMSSGGMVTKLAAARIATSAGCAMVIARGDRLNPLAALAEGTRATWFEPMAEPLTARKRWIAGSVAPAGALVIDKGAADALAHGRSLLPAGLVEIEGVFERGDTVLIMDQDGHIVGRGLAAYSSKDAALLRRHKSDEIEGLLGYRGRDEMIHRDDLVMG